MATHDYSKDGTKQRTGRERRVGPERRGGLMNHLVAYIVRLGGAAEYVGIQPGNRRFGLETLALFNDKHGSTLAVPLHELSAARVREKLQESEVRWEKSARACQDLVRDLEREHGGGK